MNLSAFWNLWRYLRNVFICLMVMVVSVFAIPRIWRNLRKLEQYQWIACPHRSCDRCGSPPSPEAMFALVRDDGPGETNPCPLWVCHRCATEFDPWLEEGYQENVNDRT